MGRLIRQKDNHLKEGTIEFIEFNSRGYGKNVYMIPKQNYTCIVNRNVLGHTWTSFAITEVISNTEFKTINGHYKIER